ncbi:high-affinity nicotinic acid transporter [Fusarium tjaetaba]|uniref:High-affinity nicotinic acid transporter n=1 Tax=Fusarium tjaetaba TaxID=1567544 RepID=A0A8H5S6Z6_9HYPO|nr:high-affinity nicotinic acid transporter [Fusarium tjaetaba]KAF5645337.1 high-affinity nicotinic acid transporter [Fusarium tjaetaba]
MSTGKPEARDLESPKMSMDEHTSVEVPADVNRRVRRLFDFRVLPIVCCLYVLSYLDRGNIGNAKTAGAQDALGLSSSQWAWVLNSFYIAYILFEWTTMFWKIFPAHIYVAALCLGWGAAAMSSGAARNMAELVITRVFLGIFEATFGAGAPYFLSCIYKREELGLRMAILLGMSPLANTFASTLAYGITHIRNSLEPWRLLFIIEGAPTIAFSVIVYFFLIDSPSTAKFLTEEEKTFAVERLPVRDNTSNQAGLSAPVYFAAFILCLASAFFSDRYGNRGYIVASFGAMGAVGYGILAAVRDSTGARYAGVWLAACGIFPALAMNITWLLNNQGGDSKKGAGLAISLTIGQCSSLISSTVFPKSAGPFYVVGCAIGCGMSGLIVILALVMHFLLSRENRKRDELYGPVDKSQAVDVSQQGDYARNFRYFT